MKKLKYAVIAAAILALTGCGTADSGLTEEQVASIVASVMDERDETAAERLSAETASTAADSAQVPSSAGPTQSLQASDTEPSGTDSFGSSIAQPDIPKPEGREQVEEQAQEHAKAAGALHVDGTKLCDADGRAVQLRGISTHGLAWFPQYVNADLAKELHDDWGADVLRLAMYTAENGGYCTDGDRDRLEQLVIDGVDYATAAGMYAIVDWHILSDGNPLSYADESEQFFDRISETLSDYDNVLYEICNEPNGGTSWQDIKKYAERIIPVIRAHDADAVILVGTPTWSQEVDRAAADPITDYDNIMYTLHFYADTHRDDLRNRMSAAIAAGLPIFVTEFGASDASGGGALNAAEADKWIALMDANGISYCCWALANKHETCCLISDSCKKTSGFADGDLTDHGRWIRRVLAGTELTAADREAASVKPSLPADSGPATSPSESVAHGGNNGMDASLYLESSWESGGKRCAQYKLTLNNTSDRDINWQEAVITFASDPTLTDSWSCTARAESSMVKLAPADYNKAIASGSGVEVGFIVSGSDVSVSGFNIN